MPITKAQQNATAKYCKKAYDTTIVRFKKGDLELIKAHAESLGKSVNGYINDLIKADMGLSAVEEETE